jgi:hypothetical protein
MTQRAPLANPVIGMTLAFTEHSAHPLAGIPGKVIQIWPRLQSGDCLVTLEFQRPVKFRNALITRIDAFTSQLSQIHEHERSRAA